MKKIDTTKWGEFALTELGFTNFHGSRLKKCDREIGTIPFATAGKENQGIVGSIGNSVTTYNNAITVDMFGNVFYHRGVIAGDDNIYFFVNDNISEKAKLYIVSTIKATLGDTFAYVDQFRQDNADALKVKLPIDANGDPDWAYIEEYMEALEKRVTCSVTALNTLLGGVKGDKQIDASKWQYFKVGKLFDGSNTGNVLVRDIEDGSGTIAYVTSSGVNNGVVAYIDASKCSIIKGNCILVGGKTFTLTYQAKDFVSNDSHNIVIHLKSAHGNEYIYLYLISAIKAMLNKKYSWGDAVTKGKLLNDSILLPATANGEPDFDYMEQYMHNIKKQIIQQLKNFIATEHAAYQQVIEETK